MDILLIVVMIIFVSRLDVVFIRWVYEGEGMVIFSDVVGCLEFKYYFIFEFLELIELIFN